MEQKLTIVTKPKSENHRAREHDLGSPSDRRDQGRSLRDKVPRESHSGWKAPKQRDPVAIVVDSDKGRLPELIPLRHTRMAQSAFGFLRGSAAIMAADLAHTPNTGINIQICGDMHLLNFGGFATPERQQIFDIHDFDETLRAPWEWDLKRLAASVVVAGRHIGLAESDSARAARAVVRAYRERMAEYSRMRLLEVWYDKLDVAKVLQAAPNEEVRERVKRRFEKARAQSVAEHDFPKLVEHHGTTARIKDNPPLIYHLSSIQEAEYSGALTHAIADYRESLADSHRALFDRYRYRDMAIKVVGVGSVGTVCLVALFMASDEDPLFLQVKEARASVLEPYAGRSPFRNHGQRVVAGRRLMQAASDIFLGYSRGRVMGRDFYIRQLHDMKIKVMIEAMDDDLLRAYAKLCGWGLARAHARSGDAAVISGYMGSSNVFDEAIAEFSVAYADQTERDHRALVKAIRDGQIEASSEQD